MKTYIEEKENGVLIKLYIQPGASITQFAGDFGDPLRLKIKIKSPPVEGAANKELIKFLSKHFKISKSHFRLLRGETSRNKDLFIEISGQKCLEIVRIINNLVK